MSGEKVIEYDVESSLSFVTSLQTVFGIMAGFVFTGTTVVLSTLREPVTLLSQLVLFVLFCAMVMFTTAMYELHLVSNLVSWQSPKQIVPLYPARLRIVNTLGILGSSLAQMSLPLMFLLKNLTVLSALSACITVLSFILLARHYKSAGEEIRKIFETRYSARTRSSLGY